MFNKNLISAGLIALLTTNLFPFTQAHTWVEQLNVIAPNGTFTGAPGFVRGNVLRTNPAFGDPQMTNLIPPDGRSTGTEILSTDLMCKSSQTIGNQTPGSPALKASAGDMIALRYQENGHVTLPQNQPGKPANRGTIFIYGTAQPSNSDTLLGIHNVWTADGKGGDGRGVLLATRNFDDGQCYQVNGGTISEQRQKQFPHQADSLMGGNLWCQSDVTLPTSISGSTYTLYWVWDWPTAAGTVGFPNGKNETYTTCMDVDISSGSGSSQQLSFAKNQDLNSAAIESELQTAIIVPVTPNAGGAKPTPAPVQSKTSGVAKSSAPAKASTKGGGNNIAVVTVTQMIQDTVTLYKTETPPPASASPKPTNEPISEGSNGSVIVVSPFHTGLTKSNDNAAPTTLATKPAAVKVAVTTVEDLFVESVTATVYASPVTPPRIRGRSGKLSS